MPKLGSPFPWVGGKRLLRDDIIALIPEHRLYVEAFAGGAWVYWGKEPSHVEVINDINGNLVNLYRQIQSNSEAFYDKLWWLLNSRDEFSRIVSIIRNQPADLPDLDRAVYYFFILKNCFGGAAGKKPSYGFSRRQPPRSAITHDTLVALTDRLSFERLIKNYDYNDAFFYCDPPFTGSDGTSDYEFVMNEEKHTLLRDQLSKIEGKFLLSYNDAPVIRKFIKASKSQRQNP